MRTLAQIARYAEFERALIARRHMGQLSSLHRVVVEAEASRLLRKVQAACIVCAQRVAGVGTAARYPRRRSFSASARSASASWRQ